MTSSDPDHNLVHPSSSTADRRVARGRRSATPAARRSRPWLPALAALALAAPLSAQTLLGSDGIGLLAWEFTVPPAGACPAPDPLAASCNYAVGACGLVPGFAQPGSLLGDIADDPLTDTYYLTDGFVIEQYTLDAPCAGPMACAPLNAFPLTPLMGPITGLGFDNGSTPTSVASGSSLLWMTDGRLIMAVAPGLPGSCVAPIVFGPCAPPIPPGVTLTDITVDTSNGTLWACDSAGLVHNIVLPGCTIAASVPVGTCGLTPPLTGLAFDTSTPAVPPLSTPPALFVTDGNVVAYVDTTGLPAPPTFYAPVTCTPAPAFLNGLALTQHGTTYGAPRVNARLDGFGQSTTPGPTFGIEVTGAPAGTVAWLVVNFNVPGPGFLCPPLTIVGTTAWVDPTPPALVNALGVLPSACVALPLPIPAPPPNVEGVTAFIQVFFIPTSGPRAVDATNALAATLALP